MKIWTAVLIGFLSGVLSVFLYRPTSKVHASGPLRVRVYEVPKGDHFDAQGSQVVGFSCIPIPSQSRCFVATSE
jgi:hypothetical protein